MEVDQSESDLAVAHLKRMAIADWSSSFVTLSPIGPNPGARQSAKNLRRMLRCASAREASGVSRTSIVIPTYRRPGLLRRAVRSALAQTHSDLEVWVYDNASGDETEAVVAELAAVDARLHYHRHQHNLG